ncbi:serine--tRNA ligase, mitochondrial, partial [Biomphalaria glabrata]
MAPQVSSTSQHQELSTEPEEWKQPFHLPEPELDWDFLLNPENADVIYKNISNRKGIGDIYKV